MFEGFEERFVDVAADVKIHCVVGGSGGPPVLLLHGYPQTLALWAGVAPILAERFTVVCSDLPVLREVGTHDGNAARHGLRDGQPEPFKARRQRKDL